MGGTTYVTVLAHTYVNMSLHPAERKQAAEPMEDEGSILRKMRRLTDYYDIHKEIGR